MGSEPADERSPFARLRAQYEDADTSCPECGYEDRDADWRAKTTGDEITYRHVCPSCGAIEARTVSVDEE